jgi:large subunit ribosomal protein L10
VNRAEKAAVIEQAQETFRRNPHLIVTAFRGLTVNQANELRRKIRSVGGTYRVVKNRLARRAAAETSAAGFGDRLTGPCGIAAHETDPVVLAKALAEFVKDNPQVELVAGVVDARTMLDAAGVQKLATLPGLLELRAQLLALIQTPATTLVRLLNTPGSQLARVVDARREQQQG